MGIDLHAGSGCCGPIPCRHRESKQLETRKQEKHGQASRSLFCSPQEGRVGGREGLSVTEMRRATYASKKSVGMDVSSNLNRLSQGPFLVASRSKSEL